MRLAHAFSHNRTGKVGLNNSALAPKLYVNYWLIAHQVRRANVSSLAQAAKLANNIIGRMCTIQQ